MTKNAPLQTEYGEAFSDASKPFSLSDLEDLRSKLCIHFPSLKDGIMKAHRLSAEIEEGNREYKFKLTDLTVEQLTHRTTQLNWRLNEGNGVAFYQLGVEDNGNPLGLSKGELQESLQNLKFMADEVGCEIAVCQLLAGERGVTAEVQMKRRERLTISTAQVMVAVAGNENSGKSTLIGVLCTGRKDNGKGLARAQVFTHDHEIATGRTSSISYHSVHFNKMGEVRTDPHDREVNVFCICFALTLVFCLSVCFSLLHAAAHSDSEF